MSKYVRIEKNYDFERENFIDSLCEATSEPRSNVMEFVKGLSFSQFMRIEEALLIDKKHLLETVLAEYGMTPGAPSPSDYGSVPDKAPTSPTIQKPKPNSSANKKSNSPTINKIGDKEEVVPYIPIDSAQVDAGTAVFDKDGKPVGRVEPVQNPAKDKSVVVVRDKAQKLKVLDPKELRVRNPSYKEKE